MSALELAATRRTLELRGKWWLGQWRVSHLHSSRGWSGTPRIVRSSTRRRPASPSSHCLAPCSPRTAWGDYSPSGSPDPWAATAKIGSSVWAEGRVLGGRSRRRCQQTSQWHSLRVQRQQQRQVGSSSRSTSLSRSSMQTGETSQQRQGARRAEETGR
ncbi:hypothetical protein Taro_008860 [Colocasia esculenta]|uniref:Uncharacterized protein n=1 Tax=Colocasia esculenta TaxID=4460 RepID=A0A843TYH1_COLES|nr:hypothetical protein [Colocasia esculenta]